MSSSNELLEAALGYASKGYPVFPVNRDKAPYTEHGFKDATTDSEQIKAWWQQFPGAGIGMPTGAVSGVWVLDEDEPGAMDALDLSPGPRARSGGGGRHAYFAYDPAQPVRNRTRFAMGCDVRGEGGYIILPPSPHPTGGMYEWVVRLDEIPPPPAPQSLLDLVLNESKSPARNGKTATPALWDALPTGQRNNTLFGLACSLRRSGAAPEAVHRAIQVLNDSLCTTPLGRAEVEKIAQSATRQRETSTKQRSDSEIELASLSWTELGDRIGDGADWLVEGIVARGLATVIAGAPKAGKSTFLGHLAAALSKGDHEFAGFNLHGKPTNILLLHEDAAVTVYNRLAATGISPSTQFLPYWHARDAGFDRLDADTRARSVFALAARHQIDLIIVDTMTRWLGADEMNAAECDNAVTAWRAEAESRSIGVIFVHHARKGRGSRPATSLDEVRGSSALAGAADCIIMLSRSGSGREDRNGITLVGTGRQPENEFDIDLDFDRPHGVYTRKEKSKDGQAGDLRAAILEAVSSLCASDPEGITSKTAVEKQVRSALGGLQTKIIWAELSEMLEVGALITRGKKRHGHDTVKPAPTTPEHDYNI